MNKKIGEYPQDTIVYKLTLEDFEDLKGAPLTPQQIGKLTSHGFSIDSWADIASEWLTSTEEEVKATKDGYTFEYYIEGSICGEMDITYTVQGVEGSLEVPLGSSTEFIQNAIVEDIKERSFQAWKRAEEVVYL